MTEKFVILPAWKVERKFKRGWDKPVTITSDGEYKVFYEKIKKAIEELEKGNRESIILPLILTKNPLEAEIALIRKTKKPDVYEIGFFYLGLDCALKIEKNKR